ncbi:MAG: glycosyl hydrolase family 30, partial [bacterium]|nr:glycosyl hydrolase family 30 [bacterium]
MNRIIVLAFILLTFGCKQESKDLQYTLYQTSAAGDNLKQLNAQKVAAGTEMVQVEILPDQKFQSIQGFGGAFTESSAYLLNQLSSDKRDEILKAYFSENGANYSLTRTHINSCDFSLTNYSYAPLEGDTALSSFSIEEDRDDIIPMIKDAQAISKDGFRVVSSPWTAPPWMKDNKTWFGGKLLPEYYATWAKFFSKYIKAYEKEGIPIWAITVENEPLGNGANWESMHYTPYEMAEFIKEHLAPQLKKDSIDVNILVYDQNRGKEMDEWIEVLLKDPEVLENIYGTAVHWYTSTYKYYPESLNDAHNYAP